MVVSINELPKNKFWRCKRVKAIYRLRISPEGKMGGKDVQVTRMDTGDFELMSRTEVANMALQNSVGEPIDIRMLSRNKDMFACNSTNPIEMTCMRVPAGRTAEVNGHTVSNTIVLNDGGTFHTINEKDFKRMFRIIPEEHQLVETHGVRKAVKKAEEASKNIPARRVVIDDSAGVSSDSCSAVAVVRNPETGRVKQYCLRKGNKFKLLTPQQTIKLAQDGHIDNLKAVERNGSQFLSGVGISIKELPDYEQ